jgi:TetR/AcrR family transcriptional repressor of lmrAB and yxaGH operons
VADSGVTEGVPLPPLPGRQVPVGGRVVAPRGAGIVADLEQLADACGTVAAAVGRFCDRYAEDLVSSGYRRGCPLATVALESGDLPEAVQQEVGAAMGAMVEFLSRRIAAESPGTAEPRDLAMEIVAAVEGALVLTKALRDTTPLTTVRDRLVARIGRELHPPSGPHEAGGPRRTGGPEQHTTTYQEER